MNLSPISARRRDDGFTLIEVLVAMLVFAIVSTGVIAGATTVIRMTADNRARITAANLASQDLDLVRAVKDPFSISASTSSTFLNSTAFTVTRTVKWVSTGGDDLACSGGTALLYLRVNVRVDWTGRLLTTKLVQDDTLIAPEGRTSTSGTGSVAILVKDGDGDPLAGVTIKVTPQVGGTGQSLGTQPAATTADGCTYANQVTPGTYVVTAAKTGYVDPTGASGSSTQPVVAGETAQSSFELDKTNNVGTNYVPSPIPYTTATPLLAADMATTFLSTNSTIVTAAPASSVALPSSTSYSAVAGITSKGGATCAAADPMAWTAGTSNGVRVQQGVRGIANGGGIDIPVGVVEVYAPADVTITAQRPVLSLLSDQLDSLLVLDDPGCDITGTASKLTWSKKGTGGWVALALPFGSWRIYENGAPVLGPMLRAPSNAARTGVTLTGLVVLDPRKVR